MSSCNLIHQWFNKLEYIRFPFERSAILLNGIYILFQKGEIAHSTNRIVRIGTHTGNDQLPSRLFQHFMKENKDRSIFRKNIGRALLNRADDPFLEKWELDLTPRNAKLAESNSIDFTKQREIEREVSKVIQDNFFFVVFRVDKKEERLLFESRIISTVSLCEECNPSKEWLGNYSPKEKIRKSGLWLVNELWKAPLSEQDLGKLRQFLA